MFQKKKHLIIGGILLLLALPVLYGVYSWNRRTPLQARFVSHQLEQRVGYSIYRLEVEIINPSLVPIYLWSGELRHPDPLRRNLSPNFRTHVPTPYNPPNRPSGDDHPAFIPAHGTVRVYFPTEPDVGELLLKEGYAELEMLSCTTTKQHVNDWLDRAVAPFTGISNSFSDWAQGEIQRDHLTLEVSSPIPTVVVKE